MDENDVAMVRRRAVQRVLTRKRQPTERVQRGRTPDSDLTISEVTGSEFLPPEVLCEWIDDELVLRAQPRGPFVPVLVAILEAGRGSERDAVAALTAAKRLGGWDQWHLYSELEAMRAAAVLPEARRLMSAVVAAWESTRGLPDSRPGYPELDDLPDPEPPEQIRYETKFGKPAGLPY